LYCDYWASVLGLQGVVRSALLEGGWIDLGLFRAAVDRPAMRLPGWRYYVVALLAGPVLIPYRLAQRLASKLPAPLAVEIDPSRLVDPHRLDLVPRGDGRVDVHARGERVAEHLVDPQRPDMVFSLVYPTYKILVAACLAILLALAAQAVLHRESLDPRIETLVRFGSYPVLVLLLFALFRDAITAFAAPLPVYVVVWGLKWSGAALRPETFVTIFVCLAVAYFVVDGFLVPRGLPPSLSLYDAERSSPLHSYEPEQAPYWLEGRYYWVWRFMYVTAAELNKVWERDWERVEVWVRAEGPHAGEVEWLVSDFHYRELWLPFSALVAPKRVGRQTRRLAALRSDPQRRAAWTLEVDMNIVFHSPEIRGLFLLPLEQGWRRARVRQLISSLRARTRRDDPNRYRDRLRAMMLAHDVVEDIPEHFRGYAIRQLLSLPWRYWRYARGANTALRPFLYSAGRGPQRPRATEPELQFKCEPPPA
jgi:hypothetical protein